MNIRAKIRIFQTKMIALSMAIVLMMGCEGFEDANLVWPPDDTLIEDPEIISIIPPMGDAFAAFSEVTISGSNFDPDSGATGVYFDHLKAEILSISTTEIVVAAPDLIGDSLVVQVIVRDALNVAKSIYALTPVVVEYGPFNNADVIRSIGMDSDENLYAMLRAKTVLKIGLDEQRNELGTTTFSYASETRLGPDGYVYLAQISQRIIWRIPPGGGAADTFALAPAKVGGQDVRLASFDFDVNHNIFAGGIKGGLLRFNTSAVEGVGDYSSLVIKSIRVFDGYVYVAGESGIWRNEITSTAGDIGAKELVFDWNDAGIYQSSKLKSITFAADGDLYVGTESNPDIDPIIVIHPDGTVEPQYPGILISPDPLKKVSAAHLVWGNDKYLYMNRTSSVDEYNRVLKINMLKAGAPYYGRQ